jgi:Domain of unknown function (DUF4263)
MTRLAGRSYQMVANAPQARSWDDYERAATDEWSALLTTLPGEDRVQRFLDRNPCFIPYAAGFATVGQGGHHGSMFSAVITQPVLPGIRRPIPDFMRLLRDSDSIRPLLVEIEAPSKKVGRRDGQLSSAATQALSQIADWKAWFAKPANELQFRELYQLNRFPHRALAPRYVLVMGRGDEMELNERVREMRRHATPSDVEIMSFDRLRPSHEGRNDLCVRIVKQDFRAVSLMPTLRLGPTIAEPLSHISGKEAAVQKSTGISRARKAFLVKRLPYWDAWASAAARPYRDEWE